MNLLLGQDRWTVEVAIEEAVAADVITAALFTRFRSRQEPPFGEKMLSAVRFGFGGRVEGQEPDRARGNGSQAPAGHRRHA